MYICVDFDGTIVDHEFPLIGKPVPGAYEWLKKFQERGAHIILFTMRSDNDKGEFLSEAVRHIENNEIKLFGVNENRTQKHWTSSPKVYGHVYIDDAALGCPLVQFSGFQRKCVDWEKAGPAVLEIIMQKIT